MSKIPEWLLESLGRTVSLTRSFETPVGVFERGYPALLVSIQSGIPDLDPRPYVTIALDPEDPSWEENISFDGIEQERK